MTPIQENYMIQQAKEIERLYQQNAALVEALEETMKVLRWSRDNKPTEFDGLITPEFMDMWSRNQKALAAAKGVL